MLQIPTKIEIHVGSLPAGVTDPEQCSMKRLGYLSFNSNERTGHQARELKSVKVNSNAYLLRLVVQQCHTNKLNIYNQVRLCCSRKHTNKVIAIAAISVVCTY